MNSVSQNTREACEAIIHKKPGKIKKTLNKGVKVGFKFIKEKKVRINKSSGKEI